MLAYLLTVEFFSDFFYAITVFKSFPVLIIKVIINFYKLMINTEMSLKSGWNWDFQLKTGRMVGLINRKTWAGKQDLRTLLYTL